MYNSKVRIVFIIYSYTMGGGAEALLTTIVNNLSKMKYDISIVEVMHSKIKVEPANDNIHVLPYIMAESDERPRQNMHDLYYSPKKVFDKYIGDGYDIYISFNYQLPSFLLPEGRNTIAWIHTSIYDLAEKGMERYLELQRGVFDRTRKIVSISDLTTKSIIDLYPEYKHKIVEIYNGIDIEYVREKASYSTNVVLAQPAIIFVGRLEERKRPDRLYEVFLELYRRGKKYHLYYLGYGPFEDELKNRAVRDGVIEFVHFLGYQSNPFPIIKQARACCLFSREEGFPMCLLESQALGVPFVSTMVGGAGILAKDEMCGSVIETNEEAMKAIMFYLESVDIEQIKTKCDDSIKRFGLSEYINKIERLIDEMVDI